MSPPTRLQSISAEQYNGVLNGSITSLAAQPGGGSGSGASGSGASGSGGNAVLQSVSSSSGADGTRATLVDSAAKAAADGGTGGGSQLGASSLGAWANASSPVTFTVRSFCSLEPAWFGLPHAGFKAASLSGGQKGSGDLRPSSRCDSVQH